MLVVNAVAVNQHVEDMVGSVSIRRCEVAKVVRGSQVPAVWYTTQAASGVTRMGSMYLR